MVEKVSRFCLSLAVAFALGGQVLANDFEFEVLEDGRLLFVYPGTGAFTICSMEPASDAAKRELQKTYAKYSVADVKRLLEGPRDKGAQEAFDQLHGEGAASEVLQARLKIRDFGTIRSPAPADCDGWRSPLSSGPGE